MINDSTKRELWKSGEGRCARCGRPLVYEETVIDHIFPKSLGGADHIDNLRLLCKQCNSKLSNRAYFSEYAFKEYLKQFMLFLHFLPQNTVNVLKRQELHYGIVKLFVWGFRTLRCQFVLHRINMTN